MTDGLRIDQWKGLKATTVANLQGNKNTKKEPSIVLWMFSDHAFWEWIIKAQITWIHKSFRLEMFLMLSRSLRSWGFYWILLLSLGGALFAIMQLFTTENEIFNRWDAILFEFFVVNFRDILDWSHLWKCQVQSVADLCAFLNPKMSTATTTKRRRISPKKQQNFSQLKQSLTGPGTVTPTF